MPLPRGVLLRERERERVTDQCSAANGCVIRVSGTRLERCAANCCDCLEMYSIGPSDGESVGVLRERERERRGLRSVEAFRVVSVLKIGHASGIWDPHSEMLSFEFQRIDRRAQSLLP